MSQATSDQEGFAAFLLRARARGLTDKALIAAVEATPRRAFVSGQWQAQAFSDRMLPIECGEAIEGLDLQAQVIAALAIDPSHRVLEIGTGSGFTAAVMSRLAARVLTLDRYKTLCMQARQRLEALGIGNVTVRHADGGNGMAAEGPFDRIVSWVAFESLPRNFVDQLSSHGVLIAPIGAAESEQALAKLTKVGSRFDREDIATVRLQPITAGMAAFL
ncbi:MAG: protein-L-isoaspartate(D-aspartate) O-methyltransferase [Mesorhizobium sp.]|nr:protein-L-isoaspartate(D-aspartate) O-methyltransferase [Mesorhizobium sp.]